MKSNWKKLLSLALVLALMLGFAPGKGMTARAAVTFKDIAFDKEWTSNNTLPLVSGNYYLTTDVTLSAQQTISSSYQTIRVYLNGHSIVSEYSDVLVSSNRYTRYEFYGNGAERISGNGNNAFVYLSGSEGDAVAANGVTFCHFGRVATLNGGKPGFELIDSKIEDCSIGIEAANGSVIKINGSEITGSTTVGVKQTYRKPDWNFDSRFEVSGNCKIDKISLKNGATIKFAEGGCLTGGTAVEVSPVPTNNSPVVFTSNGGDSTFTSGSAEYVVRKNNNNEWEAAVPPAASVTSGDTTTNYTDLSAALNGWTDDATLTLLSDVTTSSTISITGTKTLDLNGHGIKYTGGAGQTSSVITVGNGANLTLNDSGSTTHYYTVEGDGLATVNDSGAQTYSFTGGYITGANTYGIGEGYGAVHVVSGGTFTMYGGTIIGNRAERGGGVQNNGNFTLNDGTITGNISHVHGGGVCTRGENSRTIIAGGTITKNVARRFGGGLNISGPTEMSGGTISDNEIKPRDEQGQTGGGGGVYVDNSFTLTGGTISGNKAVNNTDKNNQLGGGGILIGNGQLTLSGNTVIKNNSGINGYDDLYVPTGKTIAIGGELSGESIGVTMQTPGVFTNSTNTSFNDASKFVSDDAGYAVGKNSSGQLFLAAPVTVTFDTNGRGTAPDSLTVPGGSVITSPAAPTETGYTFGGWYTEAECLNAFDFTAAVTADTTLYAKWTINQYTLTFDTDGGSMINPITQDYGTAVTASAPIKEGCTFAGWNTEADGTGTPYADGASVTLTGDLTLYAQWTSKALYTVSGTVKQKKTPTDTPLSGVMLQLVQGKKKIAVTETNDDGAFSFSAPDGIYNIVAVKDGKTKTELVTLNANQQVDITMPADNVNSKLTVSGSEITNVMVGGLDELAEANSASGQAVTVTMTVEEKENAANKMDIETVAAQEHPNQSLDCIEIKIEKTVDSATTTMESTNKVLEIVVPYRFTGKENVEVYRYHDSAAKLNKLDSKPSDSYTDGTYYSDEANGLIYIYADKFSTYAIGYTQCYNITGPINYGSFNGTVTVSLLDGGTEKYTTTANLTDGAGAYSFTHVLEGTYTLRAVWTEGGKETKLEQTLTVQ